MKRNHINLLLIVLLVFCTGIVAMPQNWKEKVPSLPTITFEQGWLSPQIKMSDAFRNYLKQKKISYGLDLAGGTQLDFVIDMSRVKEKIAAGDNSLTESDVINGVKATLQRRIDPDGTRELNIFASDFGDERHIFVELTADLDTPEIRAKLQKHIDLQFMEPNNDASEEEISKTKSDAEAALARIKAGEDFRTVAAELQTKSEENKDAARINRVLALNDQKKFKDELQEAIAAKIWDKKPEDGASEVLEAQGGYTYDVASGQFRPSTRFSIIRVTGKTPAEHQKTEQGEDFTKVADELSVVPEREIPVDALPPETKTKVLTEVQPNKISEIFELEGQFAIFKLLPADETSPGARVAQIRTTDKKIAEDALVRVREKTTTTTEDQLTFDELAFDITPNPWKATGLDGQNFKIAKIAADQTTQMPVVLVEFDDEGAKKFEDITARIVGQPMAIFVGGEFISSPVIQEKIAGGTAQITLGVTNYYEAQKEAISLANDLNAGAIPAPITLDGELKITASLGKKALDRSLVAGAIGLLLVSLWMIYVYRFLGLFAVLALAIYGILIIFVLKFIPIFVLTLPGIAGIILSIGMAVDANVLIFERMREELKNEKNFSASLAIGFERAWTSIRDSNMTSLLVCAILYLFGTSVVKGFATTLAIGVLLSMFTAITITRSLLKNLIGTKISRKKNLLIKL